MDYIPRVNCKQDIHVCVCMGHILYSFSHKFYFPVRLSSCKFNFVNFMKLGQRLIESL